MYQFPEQINFTHFFRMDKHLIMSGAWAKLPLASKAIYPTIAVHTNKEGSAFPSQETIAIMTGCTPKTVREGLDGLVGFPSFWINHWTTKRGKRANKYLIKSPPMKKGNAIRLYRSFFEGGNWRHLSSVGKAIYPVILAFSYFDFDTCCEPELDISTESEFFGEGYYEARKFDLCEADDEVLAEMAGISLRSVSNAYESLEGNFFIEYDGAIVKTFIRPPKGFKAEWLNSPEFCQLKADG